MLFVIGYMIFTAKRRKGKKKTWWYTWGPTILCFFAAIFILTDVCRHVMQDTGAWPACDRPDGVAWDWDLCRWSSSQYVCTTPAPDGCIPDELENFDHLSTVGTLTTLTTYVGFVLLAFGTMWNAKLIQKLKEIRRKWIELRKKPDQPVPVNEAPA